MQMPDDATTKRFQDAALGSLLVGRFSDQDANFVAIRTEIQESTGDPTPIMVILSAWIDDQDYPYICSPEFEGPKVLDLGCNWSVDISINESAPAPQSDSSTVLVRSGTGFFICLAERKGYLDLTKRVVVEKVADANGVACWSAFAIYLPQLGLDGPGAEIFRWPGKKKQAPTS